MRSHFKLSIRGSDWWWPLFVYWILLVVVMAAAMGRMSLARNPSLSVVVSVTYVVLAILVGLIQAALLIVCYRRAASKLSLDEGLFAFDATPLNYVGLIVIGELLTLVTVGVYLPWFARRIASYFAGHTEFRGSRFEFLGRPRALLPVWLVFEACIIAVIVFFVLTGRHARFEAHPGAGGTALTILLVELVLFVIGLVFAYAAYKWQVNLRIGASFIRWQTRALPSIGMLLGQFLLTLITLGIYWPAALLRLYRYFAGRSVVLRDGAEVARFGFDGRIGRGFWFLWGQSLLSLITAGIYLPWAAARMSRWVFERSYLERGASAT